MKRVSKQREQPGNKLWVRTASAIIYAWTIDLDEAYKVGQKAVEIALKDGNGWMSTILRAPGFIYSVQFDKVPLEKVALSERFFPKAWISKNKIDVTDEFISYVRPLIGEDWVSVPLINGRQRFSQFKPIFAEKNFHLTFRRLIRSKRFHVLILNSK